jgi:hypothetical protein
MDARNKIKYMTQVVPNGEPRKYFFDHIPQGLQEDTLSRMNAGTTLLVTRLDRNVDPNEFRKICAILPGKAKAV